MLTGGISPVQFLCLLRSQRHSWINSAFCKDGTVNLACEKEQVSFLNHEMTHLFAVLLVLVSSISVKTSHQSSELKFVLSFLVILFAWASIFHAMKQLFFTTKWSWNFVVGRWHLICGSVSLELLASNLWVCFSWIIYSLKLNCFISWILEKFFRRNRLAGMKYVMLVIYQRDKM